MHFEEVQPNNKSTQNKSSNMNNTFVNKRKNYLINVVVFIIILTILLFVMIKNENKEIEFSQYIESSLNMMFKKDFDKYIEFTDISYEEANNLYIEGIFYDLEEFEIAFEVELDDDIKQIYFNNMEKLYNQFQYEVEIIEYNYNSAEILITYYPFIYTSEFDEAFNNLYYLYFEEYGDLNHVPDTVLNAYFKDYASNLLDIEYYTVGNFETLEILVSRNNEKFEIVSYGNILNDLYSLMFSF